jgi:uncharacterized cupin superfamily protein
VPESKTAIVASEVEPRIGTTNYPPQYAGNCKTREKRVLGDLFGLSQFGVNLTTLPPGCWSSLRHWHAAEDEFIYVVEGEITLIEDHGEHVLKPGMCAGFKAGVSNGHHLVNRSGRVARYIEVGSRMADEDVLYSDVDMKLSRRNGGSYAQTRKDGSPIDSL